MYRTWGCAILRARRENRDYVERTNLTEFPLLAITGFRQLAISLAYAIQITKLIVASRDNIASRVLHYTCRGSVLVLVVIVVVVWELLQNIHELDRLERVACNFMQSGALIKETRKTADPSALALHLLLLLTKPRTSFRILSCSRYLHYAYHTDRWT